MKFKFKIQDYQTEAVTNTVDVFKGQPFEDCTKYIHDLGSPKTGELDLLSCNEDGFRNSDIKLNREELLQNINEIQTRSALPLSQSLWHEKGKGDVSLDVEMETGTGKTYVYIKTMFELNKRYGWSKFIVVVPSIAIREGVANSFKMLEDHFMENYGKKARWFIYNSSSLNQLDQFSQDAGLNVMIINTQAFNTSLKEGGRSKESRIIYEKRDEFASRRPIDAIASTRPIVIMDEPQKMEGEVTQRALKNFNPLFMLNYSATHKTKHDTVYALDALDAYKARLVKKIRVVGFELANLKGANEYLFLDEIILSPSAPPKARIEIEVKGATGQIRRQIKTFGTGDSLLIASNSLQEYKGYVISEICPGTDENPIGFVSFTNGVILYKGQVRDTKNVLDLQRLQIRETIKAHFERERELYKLGIKCLSLFFIDAVNKYRSYDETGKEVEGVFQKIFEHEYSTLMKEEKKSADKDYLDYLCKFEPREVHRGYFSIDKKTGHIVDSEVRAGKDVSENASDYDLILKDKEKLLSLEEPTRFIFSHSALREGWDNPNIFQICTLRHSNSSTAKRQEVGRGLRLAVDKNGVRQDQELLGDDVHKINILTVVANESYSDFTKALQSETLGALRDRPIQIDSTFFKGKVITVNSVPHEINDEEASFIMVYLYSNGFVRSGNLTAKYHDDLKGNRLPPFPENLEFMKKELIRLIGTIFNPSQLDFMVENGNKTKIGIQKINSNFEKEQFRALWNEINHQYVYRVSYDSEELIKKAIAHLNSEEFTVNELRYTRTSGEQDLNDVTKFGNTLSTSERLNENTSSSVKYDLIGLIANGANLTRRTTAKILRGLNKDKLLFFRDNPEEFISKSIKIIREQKASMIVDHIHYHVTDGKYDSSIFTAASNADFKAAYAAKKHVTDYVVTDSKGEQEFAKELDSATEVVVYAKLPRSFHIPTPVGSYAPDWAIAMEKKNIKHIFFVAETKGSLDSMQLNAIENTKIDCCSQLFKDLSNHKVQYHKVTSYQDLLDAMTNKT